MSYRNLLLSPDPIDRGRFGQSLAAADGLLAIGETGSTSPSTGASTAGTVHLYSQLDSLGESGFFNATQFATLGHANAATGDNLGAAVALSENRVFAACQITGSSDGVNEGAISRFSDLRRPLAEGRAISESGESVPGRPGAIFSNPALSLNGTSELFTLGNFRGPGSRSRGKTLLEEPLNPLATTGDDIAGGTSLSDILSIQSVTRGQFLGKRRGLGVSRANDLGVFQAGNGIVQPIFLEGGDPGFGDGSRIKTFNAVTQELSGRAIVQGKLVVDRNVTTLANDSFIGFNAFPALTVPPAIREGDTLFSTFGEIFPRLVAAQNDRIGGAFLASPPETNQTVFRLRGTSSHNIVFIARKGDAAPGISPPATFRSFLGESGDGVNVFSIRATIEGEGVTRRTDEGIWARVDNSPNFQLLVREGTQVPGAATGVVFRQFLRFRAVENTESNPTVVLLAKLAGPGVNRSNDVALFVARFSVLPIANVEMILREGDLLPGSPRARVGAIQRFTIDREG
ncbi:MAG: hypothetical protein KDM64_16260, partial [Verrucomicrobiae bacterium]|nr:hypothetical protein [Verrucomicrobiae bacterium]